MPTLEQNARLYQQYLELPRDEVFIESALRPTKLLKEELFDRLVDTLSWRKPLNKTLRSELELCVRETESAFADTAKATRDSGDKVITHYITVANLLTEAGVTDPDMLKAAIMQDLPEDTNRTLKDIERLTNPTVRKLCEIVAQVKPKFGETQMSKEDIDKLTVEKILGGLETDFRALFIKFPEIAHNMMTIDAINNSLTRRRKARLALDFYEPLANKLGMTGMARIIGDRAFRELNPKEYQLIATYQSSVVTEENIKVINDEISKITYYSQKDRREPDRFMVTPELESISIETPTPYEIFKNNQTPTVYQAEDVLPMIHIVTTNENDIYRWYGYLLSIYGIQKNGTFDENSYSPFIDYRNGFPVLKRVPLRIGEKIHYLTVQITSHDMEITPFSLVKSDINRSPKDTETAQKKLDQLIEAYKSSRDSGGQMINYMQEILRKGQIPFYTPKNELRTAPSGSTCLDAAYIIGPNLGNCTQLVKINGELKPLDDTIQPGDKVEIITSEDNVPIYDPNRYDLVSTNRAIENIQALLGNNPEKLSEEAKEKARCRGIDILWWIYKELTGGQEPDYNFDWVFDDDIATRHGLIDRLEQKLGLVNLPSQKSRLLPIWESKKISNYVIDDAYKIVEAAIRFKKTRWGVKVHIGDRVGIGENIYSYCRLKQININPFRTSADRYSKTPKATILTLILTNPETDEATRDALITELKSKFGEEGIVYEPIDPEIR